MISSECLKVQNQATQQYVARALIENSIVNTSSYDTEVEERHCPIPGCNFQCDVVFHRNYDNQTVDFGIANPLYRCNKDMPLLQSGNNSV